MAVNGPALASIGAGTLFAYAGIRGFSVPAAVQSIVSGKSPANLPQANPIASASTGSTSAGGLGPVAAPSSKSQAAWAAAQLAAILAPPTKANIDSLAAWSSHEAPWNASPPDGAEYTHNPLNTTLADGSVGTVNSVGVRIYPDWPTGIAAIAKTILGGYPAILAALRSGRGLCVGGVSADFLKWSGGGYASIC